MAAITTDLEPISDALLARVPRWSPDERRLATALYRALATGRPVPRERLAETMRLPLGRIVELLDGERLRWLAYYDDERSLIGFGGLAVVPMHHRLVVGDRTQYAWCAWDSLFLPGTLGVTARVESPCPETGDTIRLTVGPERITAVSHAGVVVSFLLPAGDAFAGDTVKTMASFCHYVFFFASPEAGGRWTARHEGTFLLTLEQAFELGRRKNAVQFPDATGRP